VNRRAGPTLRGRSPYQVRMGDCTIHLVSREHELVLDFTDAADMEAFLTAFGDAWARWDEESREKNNVLDCVQCQLPF